MIDGSLLEMTVLVSWGHSLDYEERNFIVRDSQRLRAEAGGCQRVTHTRWSGGNGKEGSG